MRGVPTSHQQVGNDQFLDVLRKYYDNDAAKEWIGLKQLMRPFASASTAVPSAAVRTDPAALLTLARFLPKLLLSPPGTVQQLMQPYSKVIEGKIQHPFILRWMDLLCFLLSGAPASGTLAAEIGARSSSGYRPRAMLAAAEKRDVRTLVRTSCTIAQSSENAARATCNARTHVSFEAERDESPPSLPPRLAPHHAPDFLCHVPRPTQPKPPTRRIHVR